MDGVLADFSSAFHRIEVHLFGAGSKTRQQQPEEEDEGQPTRPDAAQRDASRGAEGHRRRDAVWQLIRSTPDFWTMLQPTEPGVVRQIHQQMLRHRWDVFFITQRPATEGDTVQRQTQRWLIAQGFDMPSVLVIGGSRGAAAAALRLSYHVDDSPQNCLDVLSDSTAKPLLVVPPGEATTAQKARKLGIGVAHSIGECLEVLEQASSAERQPAMLQRLKTSIGWK